MMNVIKHAVWVCLLLCLLPQSSTADSFSTSLIQRVDSYYGAGRYLEALSLYRDCAINTNSDEVKAAAFFGLALLYDQYLDDRGKALDYYSRHIQLRGMDSARALHYSARIFARQLKMDKARGNYQELLTRYPEYAAEESVQTEREGSVNGDVANVSRYDRDRLNTMPIMVRVLIENASGKVVVQGSPDLSVAPYGNPGALTRSDSMLVLQADDDSLLVNNERLDHSSLIVRGGKKDRLQVNGRWYRSWMRVSADKGHVQVINYVSLEHYLYGVLPREVYVSWPAAALQAQAVAARTYALYHMLMRSNQDFDVLSTTSSQVYGGLGREHPATNKAVDATFSQVLFNGSQLALTLYHANSGGVVESVEDVWGPRLPHLLRVIDTPSLKGRHARWACTLGISEIIDLLEDYGVQFSDLEKIEVVKRSPSGRVQQIALKGQGSSLLLSGNSLRLMLGPSVVKSTRFIVENLEGVFRFTGTGYGHGVGMSQWGAYALANVGAGYKDILAHYYPGTKLIVWKTRGH